MRSDVPPSFIMISSTIKGCRAATQRCHSIRARISAGICRHKSDGKSNHDGDLNTPVPEYNKVISPVEDVMRTLPDLPSRAPSLVEIRRARQANQISVTPQKYQEPTSEKTRMWVYNASAIVIAALIYVVYKLSTDDEAAAKQYMKILAAELRRCRAAAKRALVASATEVGEIPLNGTKSLKFYASGPVTASHCILLHAEDGETAAFWGHVHESLMKRYPQARIISFHKVGAHFDRYRSTPITLRMRDVDVMMDFVKQQHQIHSQPTKQQSWWSKGSNQLERSSPQFVLVSHGEGAWAAATACARHADEFLGVVCVTPLLMHRGNRMAWLDALAAASRITPATDPDVLQRYLDAPPLQADARMLALDAFRMKAAGGNVVKVAEVLAGPSAVSTAEKRLAEDMRKQRAKEPVLSDLDMQLLLAELPQAFSATSSIAPKIVAVTASPDALPWFIRRDQLLPTACWLLQACNALGIAALPAPARAVVVEDRMKNAADIAFELSHGTLKVKQPAHADVTHIVSSKRAKDSPLLFRFGDLQDGIISGPDEFELHRVDAAIARLSGIFTLQERLKPDKAFSYLYFMHEAKRFFPFFELRTVDRNKPNASEQQPKDSWYFALMRAILGNDAQHAAEDVAIIPLQAPQAVVDAVATRLR